MARSRPKPISAAELAARRSRTTRIARRFGFVGRVEYRHVYSQSGGAQFGLAAAPDDDLLIVYAEAFERDANPDDYSLEAMIAHECGHQLLARHKRLLRNLPPEWSEVTEEIAASIIGSLLVESEKDQMDLFCKAIFDTDKQGMEVEHATALLTELRQLLEKVL
jgi:hypothetical protein